MSYASGGAVSGPGRRHGRMNGKQRGFLAVFQETGNVPLACITAKVGRSTHYRWLDEDPEYRKAFDASRWQASSRGCE